MSWLVTHSLISVCTVHDTSLLLWSHCNHWMAAFTHPCPQEPLPSQEKGNVMDPTLCVDMFALYIVRELCTWTLSTHVKHLFSYAFVSRALDGAFVVKLFHRQQSNIAQQVLY